MAFNPNKTIRETSPLLPTLSLAGWVSGIAEKIDRMLANYMASQYTQTVYHRGHVRSLAYTVQKYYNDPSSLASAIKVDIESLLQGFVDYVYAEVTFTEDKVTYRYDYNIDITFSHAGYTWSHVKRLKVEDSKFEMLVDINNTGKYSLTHNRN